MMRFNSVSAVESCQLRSRSDDPEAIGRLFRQEIRVSVETARIVAGLPAGMGAGLDGASGRSSGGGCSTMGCVLGGGRRSEAKGAEIDPEDHFRP
jgi:hypothetical protein